MLAARTGGEKLYPARFFCSEGAAKCGRCFRADLLLWLLCYYGCYVSGRRDCVGHGFEPHEREGV